MLRVQTRKFAFATLRPNYGNIIKNKELPSNCGVSVLDPATGKELTKVHNSNQADIDLAVTSSVDAFKESDWASSKALRFETLMSIARSLREQTGFFAEIESLQTGRPIKEMRAQLGRVPEWFEYFASVVRTEEGTVPPFSGKFINYVNRVPLGSVCQITPWNHPMLIASKKISAALAAGNSIVLKPSELAPVSLNYLAQIGIDSSLPPGILNVVHGLGAEAGKLLTQKPEFKLVDLTGGTETGKIVGASAGKNLTQFVAELGGKAPMIIFDDMDVDVAVNYAAFGSMIATGQTCIMSSRLLVHENIMEEFIEKLCRKYEGIKIGNPQDMGTQLGPLVSKQQRQRVIDFVGLAKEEGCEILSGGKIPEFETDKALENGYFYEPTLIRVKGNERVAQEEVFGPVVVVYGFSSEDEAVIKANDNPFGLAASVFTKDSKRGIRVAEKLDVGIVWINDHHKNDPSSPWGGMKDSGLGRENGLDAYRQYTQSKSIVINYESNDSFDWFSSGVQRYG